MKHTNPIWRRCGRTDAMSVKLAGHGSRAQTMTLADETDGPMDGHGKCGGKYRGAWEVGDRDGEYERITGNHGKHGGRHGRAGHGKYAGKRGKAGMERRHRGRQGHHMQMRGGRNLSRGRSLCHDLNLN